MPLAWPDLLDELRRADLLVAAPAGRPDARRASAWTAAPSVRACSTSPCAGSQADGHRFVADAVRRGAAAVVVETAQRSAVPEIVVRDGRRAALALGQAWYGHPGRRLTLIGVTGTNGKTTTAGTHPPPVQRRRRRRQHRHARRVRRPRRAGRLDGGLAHDAGADRPPGHARRAGRARGATHVAMEASSHSLDQGRLDGLASPPASSPTSPATISTTTARWRRISPPSSS